jgi:hypothetical protein
MFGLPKKDEPKKQEVFDRLKLVEGKLAQYETVLLAMGDDLRRTNHAVEQINFAQECIDEEWKEFKHSGPDFEPYKKLLEQTDIDISVADAKKLIEAYENVKVVKSQPRQKEELPETLLKKTKAKLGLKQSSKEIFEGAIENKLSVHLKKKVCKQCEKEVVEGEYFLNDNNEPFCLNHLNARGEGFYE